MRFHRVRKGEPGRKKARRQCLRLFTTIIFTRSLGKFYPLAPHALSPSADGLGFAGSIRTLLPKAIARRNRKRRKGKATLCLNIL